MTRPLLCTLVLLSPFALSCEIQGFRSATAVAAAPSAPARPSEPAAPAEAEAAAAEPDLRVDLFAAYIAERDTGLSRAEVRAVATTILREAGARDLDPALVLAVLEVESGFDNFAVSSAGAFGLMQILPATGRELAERLGIRWLGPRTLFDPVANVRLGVAYLRQMLGRYGDVPTALAAYNWGPGRIDRFLRRGRPLPAGYSRRVLTRVSPSLAADVETS